MACVDAVRGGKKRNASKGDTLGIGVASSDRVGVGEDVRQHGT